MTKVWAIIARVNFPIGLAGDKMEPGNPLPLTLKAVSRVPQDILLTIDGIKINVRPASSEPLKLPLTQEQAIITAVINAGDGDEAINKSSPILESLIDDFSFQMQQALIINNLEVLDITIPISVEEDRETVMYPNGYMDPKFQNSTALGNQELLTPKIKAKYQIDHKEDKAAMRWYIKGLAAAFEVDKFIFYWIVVEILRTKTKGVEEPYNTKCKHQITHCPDCGEEISKFVLGPSIKKFLMEECELTEKEAQDLWRMRQILHGENDLSIDASHKLPELTQLIRYAAFVSIKKFLNREDTGLNINRNVMIINNLGLSGKRKITEEELKRFNALR